jgi:hypothetical protein
MQDILSNKLTLNDNKVSLIITRDMRHLSTVSNLILTRLRDNGTELTKITNQRIQTEFFGIIMLHPSRQPDERLLGLNIHKSFIDSSLPLSAYIHLYNLITTQEKRYDRTQKNDTTTTVYRRWY